MARNKDKNRVSLPGLAVRAAVLLFCLLLLAGAVPVAVSRISGEDSWSLSLADYLDNMDYYYYEGDFASICYYRDGHDFYDLPEFGLYLEAAEAWECKETAVHWWKAYGRLGEAAYRDYAEHYQGRLEELAAESAYPENSTYLESFLGEAEEARAAAEGDENP